jgi:circadian clock protein KaiB
MAKPKKKESKLLLRLYIAGNAPNSLAAITNATAVCEKHFAPAYHIEIVDMLTHPGRALIDRIIVTPTLIRLFPLPARRIVGNLSDTHQMRLLLGTK